MSHINDYYSKLCREDELFTRESKALFTANFARTEAARARYLAELEAAKEDLAAAVSALKRDIRKGA